MDLFKGPFAQPKALLMTIGREPDTSYEQPAGVAKLVDAEDLKSSDRKVIRVQFPSSAPVNFLESFSFTR